MEDKDEELEAPVLSNEGAALLADVVARHKSSSAKGNDRRHRKDALRRAPQPVSIREDQHLRQTSEAEAPRTGSRIPVVLLTLAFLGLVITGAAAGFLLTQDSDPQAIETEVAGTTEEIPIGEDASETEADAEPTNVTEADGPDSEEADGTIQSVVNDEPEPPQDAGAEPLSIEVVGIGLSVYDVDPVNNGTRSFAIRVSNDSTEEVPSTAAFAIEVEAANGERLPGIVRFIHDTIPAGSSAIGTVRVEGVPDGPAIAVLVTGDTDVDLQTLP